MSDEAPFLLECFKDAPESEPVKTREEAHERAQVMLRSGEYQHVVLWGPGLEGWLVEKTYTKSDL